MNFQLNLWEECNRIEDETFGQAVRGSNYVLLELTNVPAHLTVFYPFILVIQSVTTLSRISKKASCKLSQGAAQTIRWRSVFDKRKQQL